MALIVAAIAASIGAGLLAERRLGARAEALSAGALTLIFWVLYPFVILFTLPRLHLDASVGAGLALAYVELAIVGVAAYVLGTRVLRLPRPGVGALIVVVIVVNTGYLGLPLVVALLGADHLGAAIVWDSLVSGPMFYVAGVAVAAAFGSRAGTSGAARVRAFVTRNPPLLAAIVGLLAPASIAPDALVEAAHVVIYALLVLGFFALGVNLAAEAEGGVLRLPLTPPIATAVVLRMVVAPALLAALSAIIIPVPDAYLLQAAMPSGINSLVLAHTYGLDLRLTSSALAWTTGLAVVAAVGLSLVL
jgi:malate permease and related proteins